MMKLFVSIILLSISFNAFSINLSEAKAICESEKQANYTLPETPFGCQVDNKPDTCIASGSRTYSCLVFGRGTPVHPPFYQDSWSYTAGSEHLIGDEVVIGLASIKGPVVVQAMQYSYSMDAENYGHYGSFSGLEPVDFYGASIDDVCPRDGTSPITPATCLPQLDVLDDQKDAGEPECGVGNPCNPSTGNKYQVETDYDGVLKFERYYNSISRWDVDQSLPTGWSHNYSSKLSTRIDRVGRRECTAPAPGDPCRMHTLIYLVGNYYFRFDGKLVKFSDALIELNLDVNIWRVPTDEEIDQLVFAGIPDSDLISIAKYGTPPFRLDRASLGTWEINLKNGDREVFDFSGRLIKKIDKNGLEYNLDYEGLKLISVTGPFGHKLQFDYGTSVFIEKIITPEGTEINFSNHLNGIRSVLGRPNSIVYSGYINSVTYSDGSIKQYHNHMTLSPDNTFVRQMTGITDENGNRYSTYAYDVYGRAILTEHAGGYEKKTLSYDWSPYDGSEQTTNTTIVKNATNNIVYYTFEAMLGGSGISSITDGHGDVYITRDAFGNIISEIDKEFNVTEFSYDYTISRLLNEKIVDSGGPNEKLIQYEYHDQKAAFPSLIVEPSVYTAGSKTKQIQYNIKNQPISIIYAGYTPDGSPVSRTITFQYNSLGLISKIDGPAPGSSDVTTYGYYECFTGGRCGQLHYVTNALGHTTTFTSYDQAGRLLSFTDPNGLVTNLTYNLRGKTTSVIKTPLAGESLTTSYEYDLAGQLSRVTSPDGSYLAYEYDAAHNLISVTDAIGNKVEYTYNLNGDKAGEHYKDPLDQLEKAINYAYDDFERLESITNGALITTYAYDAVNNLTDVTDAAWNATTREYDSLHRLINYYDAAYNSTSYTYDVNDEITSVSAPNSATTSFTYDDLGNLLDEQSPDRGATAYTYDQAGRLTTKTDARGAVSTYSYDLIGRMVGISYTDSSENVTFVYDTCGNGIGKLCSLTDGSGDTHFIYDHFGNLSQVSKADSANTLTTGYVYDVSGRIAQISYPSGRVTNYLRGLNGEVLSVTTQYGITSTILNSITYRADGQLKNREFGNGLSEYRTYTTEGKVESIYSGPLLHDYTYDEAGNVASKSSSTDHSDYMYDELYHLIDESSYSFAFTYEYDENGNRAGLSDNNTWDYFWYGYGSESNKLSTIDNGSSFVQDASGNTTSYSTPGRSWTAEYNQTGRLSRLYELGELKAEYIYNAFGQRAKKFIYSSGSVSSIVYFHYDLEGNLISETNDEGITLKEYLWVNNIPVAVFDYSINSDGDTYYLHVDNLGTPRLATDEIGTEVWRWDSSAFGGARPNSDPDGDGNSVYVNLRFPGQYHDEESGLYYNYYRYYDPETGRYITSDPIGLEGGINTYAYVENNPINATDFYGLQGSNGRSSSAPGKRWQDMSCGEREANVQRQIDLTIGVLGSGFAAFNAYKWFKGAEYVMKSNKFGLTKGDRIAPWGNRTNNKYGRWPHYHRKGQGPGQGRKRHRPWESKSTDRSWRDYF